MWRVGARGLHRAQQLSLRSRESARETSRDFCARPILEFIDVVLTMRGVI